MYQKTPQRKKFAQTIRGAMPSYIDAHELIKLAKGSKAAHDIAEQKVESLTTQLEKLLAKQDNVNDDAALELLEAEIQRVEKNVQMNTKSTIHFQQVHDIASKALETYKEYHERMQELAKQMENE